MNTFLSKLNKGNLNENLAGAYFSATGYTVSHVGPMRLPYDLLIQRDDKIQRVQVKTASQTTNASMSPTGRLYTQCTLCPYGPDAFDLLVVVCYPQIWVFDAASGEFFNRPKRNLNLAVNGESLPKNIKGYDPQAAERDLAAVLLEGAGSTATALSL